MLAVPTVGGLVESRKCVESLVVRVSVPLEGGGAASAMAPLLRRLFPRIKLPLLTLMLMAGSVTVAAICTGWFAGVKMPAGIAKFKLVVPAVAGTKLIACVK